MILQLTALLRRWLCRSCPQLCEAVTLARDAERLRRGIAEMTADRDAWREAAEAWEDAAEMLNAERRSG